MNQSLQEALSFFVWVFGELAVLFLLISGLVAWLNSRLSGQRVRSLLQGNRGYAIAVGLGAITPFCSCSTLPMTIGLIQARAAFGPIMSFLFISPLINPFIVSLFWVTFGLKVTVIYTLMVAVLAICSGYLLQLFRFERFVRADFLVSGCSSAKDASTIDSSATEQKSVSELIKEAFKLFRSFIPYLAFGVAIGAILHGFVPESWVASLASMSQWWLIPLAACIGVLLYVRASSMVPIAASLVAKGMSLGAVMSLTIAGAGASLPELVMMRRMFHWPLVLAFISVVFTTACLTGYAIELF